MNIFLSYANTDRSFAEQLLAKLQALGPDVLTEQNWLSPGANWDTELRAALEASDALVLIVPQPGTARANNAYFEAGAAKAMGKPVVAVLPSADPWRARDLPADLTHHAVFGGAEIAPELVANAIVTRLNAA